MPRVGRDVGLLLKIAKRCVLKNTIRNYVTSGDSVPFQFTTVREAPAKDLAKNCFITNSRTLKSAVPGRRSSSCMRLRASGSAAAWQAPRAGQPLQNMFTRDIPDATPPR